MESTNFILIVRELDHARCRAGHDHDSALLENLHNINQSLHLFCTVLGIEKKFVAEFSLNYTKKFANFFTNHGEH